MQSSGPSSPIDSLCQKNVSTGLEPVPLGNDASHGTPINLCSSSCPSREVEEQQLSRPSHPPLIVRVPDPFSSLPSPRPSPCSVGVGNKRITGSKSNSDHGYFLEKSLLSSSTSNESSSVWSPHSSSSNDQLRKKRKSPEKAASPASRTRSQSASASVSSSTKSFTEITKIKRGICSDKDFPQKSGQLSTEGKFPSPFLSYWLRCENKIYCMTYPLFPLSEFQNFIRSSSFKSSSIDFNLQSLVVIHQRTHHVPRSILVEPCEISGFTFIQRSTSGQVYYTSGLERDLHFSCSNHDFKAFISLNANYGTPRPSYLYIPNCINYISEDNQLSVINKDSQDNGSLISYCTKRIQMMFADGLASAFTNSEKKRSGTVGTQVAEEGVKLASSSKKLEAGKFIPSVSLGFTNQVTQEYSNCRSSIAGNTYPHLRDGNLPMSARRHLLELVRKAQTSCPGKCFDLSNQGSETYVRCRMEMIIQFQKLLGAKEEYSDFRVEGITILIPFSIGEHRDLMNCSVKGMNSVVGIHVKLSFDVLDDGDSSSKELKDFLRTCGYTSTFPCAIILYSRKVCHSHALRMSKILEYSKKDTLHNMMLWALTKRIGDVVDYNHNVFDNDCFIEMFKAKAFVRKESKFKGLALRAIAAYDKMVSRLFIIALQNSKIIFTQSSFLIGPLLGFPCCLPSHSFKVL